VDVTQVEQWVKDLNLPKPVRVRLLTYFRRQNEKPYSEEALLMQLPFEMRCLTVKVSTSSKADETNKHIIDVDLRAVFLLVKHFKTFPLKSCFDVPEYSPKSDREPNFSQLRRNTACAYYMCKSLHTPYI
jgi:hypothetical protein